jgi:putative flippase GtrA
MNEWPKQPIPVLIPAYKPPDLLVALVKDLLGAGCPEVIVVDDGGGPAYEPVFAALRGTPRVTVLTHPINLGKGAALKSGLSHALMQPNLVGVVTVDADGQHRLTDIVHVAHRLAERSNALVLGARAFGAGTPWRSRFGNTLTRHLFAALVGQRISDTQTGLRGIPRSLIPALLQVAANRYEFELEMLLRCRAARTPIVEQPIETVYIDDNRGSHFNPLFDSLRIYFVLLRFVFSALLAVAVDFVVFWAVLQAGAELATAMVAARTVGAVVNFSVNRSFVFLQRNRIFFTVAKYFALVAVFGLISYAMIDLLADQLGMPVILAKVLSEGILFIFSFVTQRQIVFARDEA